MVDDLLGELEIAFRTTTGGVIDKNGLPVTGSLRESDVPGDERVKNLIAKEIFQIVPHLVRKVRPLVKHR
jgi:hypothetical protein